MVTSIGKFVLIKKFMDWIIYEPTGLPRREVFDCLPLNSHNDESIRPPSSFQKENIISNIVDYVMFY